jgi:SAM-dependent methyltransferase
MDWTDGYVTDVGYTYGYYAELNPVRLEPALVNAGLVFPKVRRACELGFGQGLSVVMHAAASAVEWWGTDFNQAQAAFAKELADRSGAMVHLYDEPFGEFCRRTDLPDFDFIGLHGIWCWISRENQEIIVEFVRRKLAVGGVLYISYNTLPGWAPMVPFRRLLTHHAETMAAPGLGRVARIEAALEFAENLLAAQPLYAKAHPLVAERFKKIKEQNRHYLAHEYFNLDWHPMAVADLDRMLSEAKLTYACSAHFLDHVDAVNLTEAQQGLLARIPAGIFRESVRDFLVNQQFRRDYWVKGLRRLAPLERAELFRGLRVVLVTPAADVPLKVNGALGEATLQEGVYGPVLEALSDHRPWSLGRLEQALAGRGVDWPRLQQAVVVLLGSGHVQAVQDDKAAARSAKAVERLNRSLMEKARLSGDIAFLASPVTGGGIAVPRFHQLFLLARRHGRKTPREWAGFAWELLAAQGQRLVKEGTALESPEENLAELTRQAEEFERKRLPVLLALQAA